MKQALQLKIGQSLTMTPQLQQAIRLLQLSTLDLQQEIQQALESNPMLEQVEEEEDQENRNEENASETASQDDADLDQTWDDQTMQDDLPVDSRWEDVYPTQESQGSGSGGGTDTDFLLDNAHTATEDLQGHLRWQLNLTQMSAQDHQIAELIIDSINPDGFLHTSVEELAAQLNAEDVDGEEVLAVLRLIQHFDPAGVGARNLRECLSLQLSQLEPDTPWLDKARELVDQHLDKVGTRDFSQLMSRLKLGEDELRQVMTLIRGLSPRPGASINSDRTDYVVPDVVVRKHEGRWLVELNPGTAPKLRVNPVYEAMVRRADNSADNTYLKNNLQEARWFLKSLISRNETLLRVAGKIVEHQQAFLDYGEEAMKPLVLADIAEAVEMHESTISRVTTQKYMHTPRGIYELKYFFSSHVSTAGGGECSSTAIRAIIKKIVAAENTRKPLSDNKIASLLEEQGIQVARRTIAKYRESLSIPPSNERRQLV